LNTTDTILVIDDDELDRISVIRAFKESGLVNPIVTVENGAEAIWYLNHSEKIKPRLILLDLNMPKMDGFEFLEYRLNSKWKGIPVVILTTSKEQTDVVRGYQLGANGYIQKPVDYLEFMKSIQAIYLYWSLNLIGG
jgi:CheY-like chemotaxis protein